MWEEIAKEVLERRSFGQLRAAIGAVLTLDRLRGRDIHNRRTKLFGQVCETVRRPAG
jgi:hypothetical protein